MNHRPSCSMIAVNSFVITNSPDTKPKRLLEQLAAYFHTEILSNKAMSYRQITPSPAKGKRGRWARCGAPSPGIDSEFVRVRCSVHYRCFRDAWPSNACSA